MEEYKNQPKTGSVSFVDEARRERIAAMALQGLLSNPNTAGQIQNNFGKVSVERGKEIICKTAIGLADELIKELEGKE